MATSRQAAASVVLPTSTPLRLTRRGRICLVVVGAVLAAVAFSAGRGSGSTGAVGRPGNVSTSVVARSGDTLWSIARLAAPGRDPRITVEQLRRLNQLAGVQIAPGQQLLLPGGADTPR